MFGVDWIVGSLYKMCGLIGIGFLWGCMDVLEIMLLWMGGGEMIVDVYFEKSTYVEFSLWFEVGMFVIVEVIVLGEVCDYFIKIGMDRIYDYEIEIGMYLYEKFFVVFGVMIYGFSFARG